MDLMWLLIISDTPLLKRIMFWILLNRSRFLIAICDMNGRLLLARDSHH